MAPARDCSDVDVSRQAVVACLVWLALALLSFLVQGRFLAHYAIPLAIPLGVLGGLGVDVLLERVVQVDRRSLRRSC